MRVLLIDVNCKKGSTGKIVYDLYKRLKDDGHEAAICYGRGEIVKEENIFKFGLDLETNIHAGLARLTGLNGCFSFFSTKRLLKFIKNFKPDIVHIHELHAYFVNWKPLIKYLKKHNIKTVWTFHCEYMYTGKCGHAYECERWKSNCGSCPEVKDYPKSIFLDFTKKMLKGKKKLLSNFNFTIVTPSQWLANRVKQSFLCKKQIVVIQNGIDAEKVFYPRSEEEINCLKQRYKLLDKKLVLSVAPNIMSESKGGKKVLEISKEFEEENVHFVLIGAEENQTIGQNVTLIKRTTNQSELALWYSAADVFLICSKRENFPTTCLEALCCGTPIVGIDEGGTKETAPTPYGAFVKQNEISELKNVLKAYIDGISNLGYEKISLFGRNNYDNSIMYNKYLSVYQHKQELKTNNCL